MIVTRPFDRTSSWRRSNPRPLVLPPFESPSPTIDRPANHNSIANVSTRAPGAAVSADMCLVKVRQEEDVVVPYRVARDRSPRRRESVRRVSRISQEVIRESPRPSSSYVAVPAPRPMPIPAPQPVPVFVEPPPAPLPPPPPSVSHHSAHYVEVSPARSSISSVSSSSMGRSEYVVRERQYRRREHSPASSSPRYEHFRYVEPAPGESDHYERYDRFDRRRSRSRPRERSLSRGQGDYYGRGSRDYGGGERVTRERITISERDRDGRRNEYRR